VLLKGGDGSVFPFMKIVLNYIAKLPVPICFFQCGGELRRREVDKLLNVGEESKHPASQAIPAVFYPMS
jgi:hypothetical protein